MEELQQQQQAGNFGTGAAAGGAGQDAAASSSGREPEGQEEGMADLDYEAEEMSAEELQVLSSSKALVAAAEAMLKAFSQALLKGTLQKPVDKQHLALRFCNYVANV
jgi:hypothetical protein